MASHRQDEAGSKMIAKSRGPNKTNRHPSSNPDRVMSTIGHLDELRTRILWAGGVTGAVALALAVKWRELMAGVLWPWHLAHLARADFPGRLTLLTLSPTEPFFTVINVVLAAALVVSSPVWIYQAWRFLAPALPLAQRAWMRRALLAGLLLFWTGAAFAFFGVIPASLRFLMTFANGVFAETVRASSYLDFVTTFSLALGAVFAIPMWLGIAVKLGWLTTKQLKRGRRIAFFASAVFSAAVVPSQDPLTLLAVIVPVFGLYEATVQISSWIRPLS
ncbi:MAG: twin-arginine translocase subunit TatC [Thermaerobacter sp.]|nr:twin-arginine translocase subunit TatC [Thermaerobacter sp.]